MKSLVKPPKSGHAPKEKSTSFSNMPAVNPFSSEPGTVMTWAAAGSTHDSTPKTTKSFLIWASILK